MATAIWNGDGLAGSGPTGAAASSHSVPVGPAGRARPEPGPGPTTGSWTDVTVTP